jgi:hypothetical protein
MNDSIWLFVFAQVATAGGVYAAIRADLREHQVRIAMLEERNREHKCS